jgi:hypothetical protein
MGAICLQGPHHSAQKSTKIGVEEELTVSSNVELVRVMIPAAIADPFVGLHFTVATLKIAEAAMRQGIQ